MMVGGVTVLLIVGGAIFVIRDWLNPDARANRLFVEASQLVKSAQEAEQTSYAEAFKLYQAALTKAETITAKYPSSQLAVQLTADQTKIGPYTFPELQKIVPRTQARAKAEEDFLACALFVASTIQEASEKDSALRVIAIQYGRAKQYDRAMEVANSENASDKPVTLQLIANALAKAGQYDRALQVANTIEDASHKAWALAWIASGYAKDGRHDDAARIANSIEKDTAPKTWALVEAYAHAGQYDRALQVANTITDVPQKNATLVEIYAKAGQYDRALQVANTIEDAHHKAYALVQIATAYINDGQHDRALQITNTMKRDDAFLMLIVSAYIDARSRFKARPPFMEWLV
jgi:tetratricopeptide (TPR) repeat protein